MIPRRRKNESILIGNDIRITIIKCTANDVRPAIDAPKQVSIIREELLEARQINKHAISPNATSARSLHAAFKQYTLKNGDEESP